MKYLISPFFLSLLVFGLATATSNVSAQGNKTKPNKTVINDCEYTVLSGLAEVTKVEKIVDKENSLLGYDEYEVFFVFTPKDGGSLLGTLRDQEIEFLLNAKGEKIHVGPKYLKQYQVRKGTKYAMKFMQGPTCEEKYRWADYGGLPNDFSEAADKIDDYKRKKLEEGFKNLEAQREPELEPVAIVPPAPTKEDSAKILADLAAEQKRKEDSIAEYKRNYAFYEQERKRLVQDSLFMEEEKLRKEQEALEEQEAAITKVEPIALPKPKSKDDKKSEKEDEPNKKPKSSGGKDDDDNIIIDPIEIDTNKVVGELDTDRIRREAQEKIAREIEAERKKQEQIEAERLKKIEADRMRDSIAQAKIQAKELKKMEKDSIKRAKEEAKMLQDSLEREAEKEKMRIAVEEQIRRAEEEKLRRQIEEEVRLELLQKEEERKAKEAEEKLRAEQERKSEEERKRLEAERLAAEKKRLEDELKRGDCAYQEKIAGSILITSLAKVKEASESHLGYAEYEVKFKFTPANIEDIPKKDRKFWDTEHTFVIDPRGQSANPSAAYISTYNVLKNARFNGFAEVLQSGICNAVIVYARELPIDPAKTSLK